MTNDEFHKIIKSEIPKIKNMPDVRKEITKDVQKFKRSNQNTNDLIDLLISIESAHQNKMFLILIDILRKCVTNNSDD